MRSHEKTLVSVVVPVYNAEKYLRRCIDSILAQTHQKLELILVDDGSSDSSGAICDEYAQKDSRVTVIHQENAGASTARNAGVGRAKGEYLFFVDSDDWVEQEHIALLLPVGNEDLVYCGYNLFSYGTKISESSFATEVFIKEQWHSNFSEFWNTYTAWSVWRGCYKTKIIQNNYLKFDVNMTVGEDEQFNLQYFARCQSVRFSGACTYNYETGNDASTLHRYHSNRTADCIKICQTIEKISQHPEHSTRWYYWHSVIRHFVIWHEKFTGSKKREVFIKMKECFNEPYFRECLPYVRKHGSLDEKIETFFMRIWLHPMYEPVYGFVAFLSKVKNNLLRKNYVSK